MNHFTTPDFWELYNALPKEVRELADKNFGLLQANPAHPSLHFKSVKEDVWSVRVGRNYRALAFEHEAGYDWFWIGPMPNTIISSRTNNLLPLYLIAVTGAAQHCAAPMRAGRPGL